MGEPYFWQPPSSGNAPPPCPTPPLLFPSSQSLSITLTVLSHPFQFWVPHSSLGDFRQGKAGKNHYITQHGILGITACYILPRFPCLEYNKF